MKGLPNSVDWLRLTWNHRQIKSVGPYKEHALYWQKYLDWALCFFPRTYIQLARGHDKTERASWWALLWGLTMDHGQGFACGVDRDNARLFRDAAKWQVSAHPELFKDYKIYNYDIVNKRNGTIVRVLASDEESNYGLTPDLLLVNDFHAWRNKDFWNALWTAMGKRRHSRMWIESNALAMGTPQIQWIRPIRSFAKKKFSEKPIFIPGNPDSHGWRPDEGAPEWFHYAPQAFLASWQNHMLSEWKETMLPAAYRRLIENQDTSEGDQYLTPEQVEAVEIDYKHPVRKRSRVVIGVDIGYTQDSSVVSVVSLDNSDPKGKKAQLILHHMDVWTGSRENPVAIKEVVAKANMYRRKYKGRILCDPYELRWILQENPYWEEFTFTSNNLKMITTQIYQTITKKRLKIPKECAPALQAKREGRPTMWDLKRELTEAVLKEMSYGLRIDHRSGGFTDRIMSLGIAIVTLLEDDMPAFRPLEKPQKARGEAPTMGKIIKDIIGKRSKRILI